MTFKISSIFVVSVLFDFSMSSSICHLQNSYMEENYLKGALWARRFRDSWGRFPSGIFSGNHYDFGNFDQCIDFDQQTESFNEIRGQYCLLMFPCDTSSKKSGIAPKFVLKPYS